MIIRSEDQIDQLKQFIDGQTQLAVDIETTGLNVRKDQILGISVSNDTHGFYLVHKEWSSTEECCLTVLPESAIQQILNSLKTKKLITWNGAFDLPFIKNYFKIDLINSLWSEGMLAKHTVDEERPFGLKEVASKIFGDSAKQEQQEMLESILQNGGHAKEFYKASTDKLAKYAIKDTILTFKLNEFYLAKIEQEGLTKFYFEDEVMPLYKEVTIPMENHGIKLDMPFLVSSKTEISEDIQDLEHKIREKIQPYLGAFEEWFLAKEFPPSRSGEFVQELAKQMGVFDILPKTKSGNASLSEKSLSVLKDCQFKRYMLGTERLSTDQILAVQKVLQGRTPSFNLQSKHHWKKVFFDHLNESPLSKTETGLPQCDDDFLNSVKDKYDFVPLLLDYNKLNKLKSTYIDRFIEESEGGIFYPSYLQHSTISGRYGGDFQQLPRAKEKSEASEIVRKYNNRIRKFFIAREGRVFLDADYESLEPKIFAHISNETSLQTLFAKGHDFYSTVAIEVFNPEGVSADKSSSNYLGKINKPLRQTAKAIALSIPYGKQPFGLSKDLNVSERDAKNIYARYMAAFPKLADWMQKSKQQVLTKGFIKIESGRIRHFKDIPAIYSGYGDVLLDPLKVWEKWGKNKQKYDSMKYLSSKLRNSINNASNVQCQGLAASVVNQASIAINREFRKLGMDVEVVANCHDQLVCEAPVELAQSASKIMQQIMENNYKISVPLTAPVNIAGNLHDSH